MKRWPDTGKFIRSAEAHYEKEKAKSPSGYLSNKNFLSETKDAAREKRFKRLVEHHAAKGEIVSDRHLAWELHTELKDSKFELAGETLRKRIKVWKS